MTAGYRIEAVPEYTEADRAGLEAMKRAVYPPERFADSPGRLREWTPPGWGVLVTVGGEIVSYTGIVVTEAAVNGRPAAIGGVGSIATHPAHRGQGHASRSIEMALDWMAGKDVEFAMLVCRDELVPYYERGGWDMYAGELLVSQFGERETFTFNRVMVRAVTADPPSGGVIDIGEPPW